MKYEKQNDYQTKQFIKWQKSANKKFDYLFQLSICTELYEIYIYIFTKQNTVCIMAKWEKLLDGKRKFIKWQK